MEPIKDIQRLHALSSLVRVGYHYRYAASLVDAYRSLSDEERRLVAGCARQLVALPGVGEAIDAGVDRSLVEVACLVPGARRARRGLPSLAAVLRRERGGFPATRRQEASGWLASLVDDLGLARALLGDPEVRGGLQEHHGALPAIDGSWVDQVTELGRFTAQLPASLPELTRLLHGAYQVIDPGQGARLAGWAVGLLDAPSKAARTLGDHVLLHLTCFVPGSLAAVHEALLDRGVMAPGELFRGATGATRQALRTRLEHAAGSADGPALAGVLVALAWAADTEFQATFWQWAQHRPLWQALLPAPLDEYAKAAGWVPGAAGGRLLYWPDCHRLIPAADDGAGGPVSVFTGRDDRCGWCSLPLICLVDLDLSDARLGAFGLGWKRLHVAGCERCTPYGVTFSDLDRDGGCRWSRHNVRPAFLRLDPVQPLPRDRLALGPPRRSPFEAHWGITDDGGASQVGGHPQWLQHTAYPDCPGCQQPMAFLAQVQTCDLGEPAEGVWYAFVCGGCSIGAASYQQT